MADSFRGRLSGLFHPVFELAVVFGLVVTFKQKFDLPFALLADPAHSIAEAYGVWVEKSMYGKKYMGVARSTFVIDADGTVVKVMRKVKPETHADDVLAALGS